MDFRAWRERLEGNRRDAPPPESAASTLPPARRAAIAQLLARYAGGEQAEHAIATLILAGAHDVDDRAALELLLDDERRHGEMLEQTATRLGAPAAARRRDVHGLIRLARVLSFVEIVMVFHLMEVAVSTAYRVLRAANRTDPLLRDVLGAIVRDEVVHKAFHEQRLRAAVRDLGPLRRAKLRAVHILARHLLLTGPYHVVPHHVYEQAMGISFAQFKTHLRRAYDRAYSGELAWLRGAPARS